MSKIRVLETIRQGKIGGGESHVLTLVQELDKSLFEPIVLSFTPGPMVEELQKMGIKTHVIYSEKGFDVSVFSKVKQLLTDEKIQLVHNHGTRATSNLWWAARKLGIPMIYTVHGWSFHDDLPFVKNNIRILSEWFLSRRANRTISVSHSNQATGKKHIPGFTSTVIHNGLDLKKFNPDGITSTIRQEYNIPQDHVVIGYIVRMDIQKDPLSMVRAFKKVSEVRPNTTLLMIGEGPLKQETAELVKTLGIENRVVMDNFRQDVPNVLAGIDIYCLPSLWEGLAIGMLEAMAMRKCVVASAVDGSIEVIKDRENGLLITPQKPDELARTLIEAIDNTELRNTTATNAYQMVKDKFSAPVMTQKVQDLYFELLNKKR